MNETITKEEIKKKIYEVRGQKVMLASDLAKLFKCKNGTKEINQALKRNREKFFRNSYFQLTYNEYESIYLKFQNLSSRSQPVTLNGKKNNRGTNLKYLPYVFTSDGIETLSHILKSEKIREISKIILAIFNEEKQYQIIKKMPEIQVENVRSMIYELNGIPIMLDYDLAKIYGCKNGAKTINLAVKRNIERFPNKYYFQLSEDEFNKLRFQIETANQNMMRSLPYAFSEQGVYMLATILRTENAVKVSLNIMEAFVLMRKFLEGNQNLILNINSINNRLDRHENNFLKINERLDKQDKKIEELFNSFKSKEKKELLFMNGEVYDSYSKIIDILDIAKKELIIVDGYADKNVLDIISKLKVNVTLILRKNGILKEVDIKKYKEQYNNLTIIYSNDFHDRFIILDNNIIYHLGASINYAGSKVFAINKLEEKEIKESLIKKINSIL